MGFNMKFLNIFGLALLLIPTIVQAETVVRLGDAITVEEAQVVDGDYYVSVGPFGNTTMSGDVNGDMYALGGSVTANGNIAEDVFILSGITQFHASATGDVRMVTGEAVVANHVGGDLFVLAGTLNVLSTATIDGNIYFFGGSGTIDGKVAGSVLGTMERLRLDGQVGDRVDVKAIDGLTLGSRTSVEGDVRYESIRDLVRAPEAVVEGEVSSVPMAGDDSDDLRANLIPLFIVLFATLSLYLLFRKELEQLISRIGNNYTKHALAGLSVIILGPIVSVILMITVLGLIVGVATLALTVILYALGYALSGVLVGAILSQVIIKQKTVSLVWITVGTVSLYLISFVPIIGPILVLTAVAVSIGGLAVSLYRLLG